jgi:multidrug efflux pump subunit AcrA (membrane-fusion protein)
LETAALNVSFTRVTSPIAGRTGRAEVTRGNLVTGGANGGTLLTSVVSMDPMYLYFEGDEQAYLRYNKTSALKSSEPRAHLRHVRLRSICAGKSWQRSIVDPVLASSATQNRCVNSQ